MHPPKVQPQDMYNEIAQLSADQQLSIVAELPGRLDPGLLERAAAALVSAEPVLGCRYVKDPKRPRFEFRDASEIARPLVRDSANPHSTALAWAAIRVDPTVDPLFAVALFRGPESDVLALRIHHVASDGQGAKEVAYRFAETYSRLSLGEEARLPSGGSRSGLQVLRHVAPWWTLLAAFASNNPRPRWGVPVVGEPAGRAFEVRTLDAKRLAGLRAYGKRQEATVNDLVVTAVYRALFEALDAPDDIPMLLNVSFDLRRYLPNPPTAAALNASSIETLEIQRMPSEDFADTLSRVSGLLTELKNGNPGLRGAVLMEMAGRLGYSTMYKAGGVPMERGREHGVSFPFVSNFGVLDAERLRFGDLEPVRVLVLPPSSLPPFVMVGASTWAGRLSLVVGYPPAAMPEGFVPGLLDITVDQLEEIAGEREAEAG